MKIRSFSCPSCGASLKVDEGQKSISCPYCDSTVIVPEHMSGDDGEEWKGIFQEESIQRPVRADTGKSCATILVPLVIFIVMAAGALVFWLANSSRVKEALEGPVAAVTGGPDIPVAMEFGGEGMRAGYFQDAAHVRVDPQGNIYVGESSSGRVQIFDPRGDYTGQWEIGKSDQVYLHGMDISRDGRLFLVYDSELYIHDAASGELLGQLHHPEGWGFDDVAVCDDGSVVASWYCNRDDIVRFAPDGSLEFVIREAVSGQSGSSELNTEVAVDGDGNIFAYGSFNGSFFKFSPSGRFLNRFGSDGDRPGQFTSPSSFCIDHMGRVWVSDFGDLIVFDNDGTYLDTFDPGMSLSDIYMGDGYMLYGITHDETVVQLDLSEMAEGL